jgi:hypothetical protein
MTCGNAVLNAEEVQRVGKSLVEARKDSNLAIKGWAGRRSLVRI